MTNSGDWRAGEQVEWVGPDYVEEGIGIVRAGTQGTFVVEDRAFDPAGLVVWFEPVGAFCCRLDDVRRPST